MFVLIPPLLPEVTLSKPMNLLVDKKLTEI